MKDFMKEACAVVVVIVVVFGHCIRVVVPGLAFNFFFHHMGFWENVLSLEQ